MTNNSSFDDGNVTVDDPTAAQTVNGDVMDSILLRTLLISAYSIVFVLGVAGNTLVVYVVWSNSSMRSITNVFIANLAASDIMMCLLAVPFTPISGLLKTWVFGDLLCHLVPMALGVCVYVSTLTSTAIAIDRYFVIVHPFRPRIHIVGCIVLIVAIWLVSVSISLPLALYQEMRWDPKLELYECHEQWPGPASRQFFTVVSLGLQYIVPCLIITYCYACVSSALQRRACVKIGTGSVVHRNQPSPRQQQVELNGNRSVLAIDDDDERVACTTATTQASAASGNGGCTSVELRNRIKLRRKRRTNKMLIAMVAIFIICWMPLNVIILTLEYYEQFGYQPYFLSLFFVAHVIAMSSTVYNPFLYAWMNDNFRKEFRRVLPCLRWSPRRAITTSICGRRLNFRFSITSESGFHRSGGNASPSFYSTVGFGTAGQLENRRLTVLQLSRRKRNTGNNNDNTTPSPSVVAGAQWAKNDVEPEDVFADGSHDGNRQRLLVKEPEAKQRYRQSQVDPDEHIISDVNQTLQPPQMSAHEPRTNETKSPVTIE